MTRTQICGIQLKSVGVVAMLLYIIDRTLAQDFQTDDGTGTGNGGGDDYLEVPQGLAFTCDDKIPGYYADPVTNCRVWHWCVPGNIKYSFVCGPGTAFNQRTRVCDWAFNVDCPNAASYYGINEDLYKDDQGNFIAGKK